MSRAHLTRTGFDPRLPLPGLAAATAASVAFATRSKAAWKLFGSRAASFADKLAAANVQRNPNWNCLQELTPPLVKQPVYTK